MILKTITLQCKVCGALPCRWEIRTDLSETEVLEEIAKREEVCTFSGHKPKWEPEKVIQGKVWSGLYSQGLPFDVFIDTDEEPPCIERVFYAGNDVTDIVSQSVMDDLYESLEEEI
jgi:hypothetical protein